MIIHDLDYLDRLNCAPIQSAIFLRRWRILSRPDDETLSVRELQGKLTVPVATQLMTSARQVLEILKTPRRFQVGEPSRDFLGTPITVLLLK